MTPSDNPQSAQRRRDNFFRGTLRDPATRPAEQDNDVRGNDDPLVQRAELHLHEAVTNIAQSIGIPSLDKDVVATMVQKAKSFLRGMSRQQLASLSPSSAMLQSLAATTFNPAMTPEAAQRQRLEQLKASYHGTGIAPTDAQLARLAAGGSLFGYGRGADGRSGTGVGSSFGSMDRNVGERRVADYGSMSSGPSVYSYSPVNYGSSDFHKAGLGYSSFNEMRTQGFERPQIARAVKDVSDLKVDMNTNAPRAARLNRDAPEVVPAIKTYRTGMVDITSRLGGVEKSEAEAKRLDAAGQTAAAAQIREQATRDLEQLTKKYQEERKKVEDAIRTAPPERREDAVKLLADVDKQFAHTRQRLAKTMKPEHVDAKLALSETQARQVHKPHQATITGKRLPATTACSA